jgi:hypothetical protein
MGEDKQKAYLETAEEFLVSLAPADSKWARATD